MQYFLLLGNQKFKHEKISYMFSPCDCCSKL